MESWRWWKSVASVLAPWTISTVGWVSSPWSGRWGSWAMRAWPWPWARRLWPWQRPGPCPWSWASCPWPPPAPLPAQDRIQPCAPSVLVAGGWVRGQVRWRLLHLHFLLQVIPKCFLGGGRGEQVKKKLKLIFVSSGTPSATVLVGSAPPFF